MKGDKMKDLKKAEGSRKLLIVEDRLENLTNAYAATMQRGYEVDLALDLEDALELLGKTTYAGVITDMCFHERGCYSDQSQRFLKNAPEEVMSAYERASKKNEEIWGSTTDTLRKHILRKTLRAMPFDLIKRVEEWPIRNYGSFELMQGITEANLKQTPALGYYVVERSKEENLPVVVITSLNHAINALPALYATGLVDAEELKAHTELDESSLDEGIYRGKMRAQFLEGEEWREWNRPCSDYGFDDKQELSDHFLYREMGLFLNRAIITKYDKQKTHYKLSIDQIEGNIDETRPYVLED